MKTEKKVNVFNERVDRRGLLVLLLLPLPLLLTPPCGQGCRPPRTAGAAAAAAAAAASDTPPVVREGGHWEFPRSKIATMEYSRMRPVRPIVMDECL